MTTAAALRYQSPRRALVPVAETGLTLDGMLARGLAQASAHLQRRGIQVPRLEGQLLRPATALALVPDAHRSGLPIEFWYGALAVQMVHEASLLHDDVLDQGTERRGRPTLVQRRGAGAALLQGDALLTGAYCAAQRTGSAEFMEAFVGAVERTVRGEMMQAAGPGAQSLQEHHDLVIRAKSGALFGVAASLAGLFGSRAAPEELRRVGVELGALYQRVDDFLDYLPAAATGKPRLQDFRNRVWTWMLEERGSDWFEQSPEAAARAFVAPDPDGTSMAQAALTRLRAQGEGVVECLRRLDAHPRLVGFVDGWVSKCARALHGSRRPPSVQLRASKGPTPESAALRALASDLGQPEEWAAYFNRNSRTFSFAAALFRPVDRRRVRNIYAFCRFTDDLVDGRNEPVDALYRDLDEWLQLCRASYDGQRCGLPVVDEVMEEMARSSVPFECAEDLIDGVRMDIEPRTYDTLQDLRLYTHRVASVVGIWLTRSFGVHDPWALERAGALGHAMQVTNILRDVGEDLEMGRIYLPQDLLRARSLSRGSLVAMQEGGILLPEYVDLLEVLMAEADRSYQVASAGLPRLPGPFRRAASVAASIYRGIHDEIRRNGYDNLTRRAVTGPLTKLRLALKALGPAAALTPSRAVARRRRAHGR